jgi:hypothetical protein
MKCDCSRQKKKENWTGFQTRIIHRERERTKETRMNEWESTHWIERKVSVDVVPSVDANNFSFVFDFLDMWQYLFLFCR